MKDLYRRNQLKALEADAVKINNSKGLTLEDSEAAFSILLNAERKQQYDQAFKTLSAIGGLRERFDLNNHNHWHHHYADFVVEDGSGGNFNGNTHHAFADSLPPSSKKNHTGFIYLLVGIVAIVSIVAMFSGPSDEQKALATEQAQEKNIWKYTLENVALYETPDANGNVIGEIKQFEDTRVFINKGTRQWDFLHYGYLEGYVKKDLLAEGNGEAAYVQHCRSLPTTRPVSGSPLTYSTTGPHTLMVINPPGDDALIKLRDMEGREVIFYYLHGGQTLTLNDIPEGAFQFSYATGKNFSPGCGRFLDEMRAWKDDNVVTFRMEKTGQIEHTSSESFSLKDQFSVNKPIDTKTF